MDNKSDIAFINNNNCINTPMENSMNERKTNKNMSDAELIITNRREFLKNCRENLKLRVEKNFNLKECNKKKCC